MPALSRRGGTPNGYGVRFRKLWWALAGLPFVLGGCGALGLHGTLTPGAAASATPAPGGTGWIVVATGSATPSPGPSIGHGSPAPVLPPVALPSAPSGCVPGWNLNDVLIPMTVKPGKGSFTVSWPRQWDSDYRITAVPQTLVSGSQPAYSWRTVTPTAGCTVSVTLTGLAPGKPYVIWLDAPNTGYERDGSRHPYSGRSGVVYPL
jgi:hypothetical protein